MLKKVCESAGEALVQKGVSRRECLFSAIKVQTLAVGSLQGDRAALEGANSKLLLSSQFL